MKQQKRRARGKPAEPEHRLDMVRISPVHAICSCDGWRYKADLSFHSTAEAVLHVSKWFDSHKRIEKRRAA